MLADGDVELIDCPDCALPAYVEHRFAVRSTDGPIPHAVTICPRLHRLCTAEAPAPAAAVVDGRTVMAPQALPHGPWDDADESGARGR